MRFAEQLTLPLTPSSGEPVSIVMIFKDTHTDNPRVLISQRLRTGYFGYPGGSLFKNELKQPAKGARRETFEETGIRIDSVQDLREFPNSPIRIAAEGKEREVHVFYYIADQHDIKRPQRREFRKHSPWRYYPIRLLPHLVTAGVLHPISCQVDVLSVAHNASRGKKRHTFKSWIQRDSMIKEKLRTRSYEFLDYIHDKEDGHLVF